MRKIKTIFAIVLTLCMLVSNIPTKVVAAQKIKLNKESLTLYVGKTKTLKLKGTTQKPKWSSSNKRVATVTNKGKVKAKKQGTAKISAKLGNKKYTCKIKVKKKKSASKKTQNSTQNSTQNPTGNVTISIPMPVRNGLHKSRLGQEYYTLEQVEVIAANPWNNTLNEVTIRLTGRKTSDSNGDDHASGIVIGFVLYNSSGERQFSTTVVTTKIKTGERFEKPITLLLPDGNYNIQIE